MYEAPLPTSPGEYAHRFNADGICIRCGEDAEEWDAGCVEELLAEANGEPVPPPFANFSSGIDLESGFVL